MNLPFALNPVLRSLPVYQPGRPIEEVARELGLSDRRIIKLASNENPLGPSPAALAALKQACRQIAPLPGRQRLLSQTKTGGQTCKLTPANLILGNGSNDIIEFLGHALLGPGDEVVVSAVLFCHLPDCRAVVRGQRHHRPGQKSRPRSAGHGQRHHGPDKG